MWPIKCISDAILMLQLPPNNNPISGMTQSQLLALESLGKKTSFEENELIVVAGERSTMFYLVLTGSASVEVASDFCTIAIQALSAGDIFGWSSLLDHHDTLFQVRAREQCSALCLDGAAVAELCRSDPTLGVKLLQRVLDTVAGRVGGLEARLAEFCGFSRMPVEA